MPDTDFAGRAVIVIGAAGALGAGLARAFVRAGAQVTGVDMMVPVPDRQLDGVSYRAVNVLEDAALAGLFGQGPPPWAVVNTVGGFAAHAPLPEMDPAVLTGQLELNVVSAALVTKHALRQMTPAGQGRIVHTASRAPLVTQSAPFAYSFIRLVVLHPLSLPALQLSTTGP